jgi:Ectoine synthase
MIIRTKENLKGTKGERRTRDWSSCRFLHTDDGMGVTLTDAILEPGLDQVSGPSGTLIQTIIKQYRHCRHTLIQPF